jgi:hypothetical protein
MDPADNHETPLFVELMEERGGNPSDIPRDVVQ